MAAPLRDRLGFLSRLPTLMKGTSDDDVPCPGYLFEEIAKISHDSPGSSQCLLEHLLNRLQNNSCHVKLKVLKILLYMCTHGSSQFLQQLKRNSTFVQEAAVFAGTPDPLHGNSLYQKVRAAAQDLASALFLDTLSPPLSAQPSRPLPPTGMGCKPGPCSSLQGFGFTSEKSSSPSAGEALLATIQKAAEAVASAVLPSPEFPLPCPRELQDDAYQPVTAPSPGKSCVVPQKPPAAAAHSMRVCHQPGQAGGGWEETDSGHSSQNSSQENGELSRTSDSYSKSGSDSPSGASRELGNVTERVEGDCLQELSLVSALTRGSKVFLTREEAQHFIKECGLLNCEVVLELLSRTLQDPSQLVCMRSMCAISSLLCSDLLAHEQISVITRPHLQQLSQRRPGPVSNKATKLLRQFEALCRSCPSPKRSEPDMDPSAPAGGSPQHTRDLLMDLMPLAGDTVLKPVSLTPFLLETCKAPAFDAHPVAVPAPAGEQSTEAETCEQFGDVAPGCRYQQEVECRLTGPEARLDAARIDSGRAQTLNGRQGAAVPSQSLSLFAGMELVALPGTAVASPGGEGCASCVPQTLPCTGTASTNAHGDSDGSREPSAFSFLNM
ncbi:AP-4 complex accessory subunit tepsin isoform X1 [Chelonoidis abingdonii]|uniref:AP-4 complex accessory subunit tepsin isoform X1 n=1 Tax=Chelonoidis abingdonii TaxID=106734 RepID=UPI0013F2781F|nr:AP-4 complex accessory subunit tepsin isoform X1 [Chelonoidis abingdonii]